MGRLIPVTAAFGIFSIAVGVSAEEASSPLPPPMCGDSTPGPKEGKCSLKAPSDPDFARICIPGAVGHAGGAERPDYRCPRSDYTEGVFRCACCGEPLFYAASKFQPPGDGWPAFHAENATDFGELKGAVCTPPYSSQSEVVCSKCGSHLGDYFAPGTVKSFGYYCIDGVCMLPPDAEPGDVCQPASSEQMPPSEQKITGIHLPITAFAIALLSIPLCACIALIRRYIST